MENNMNYMADATQMKLLEALKLNAMNYTVNPDGSVTVAGFTIPATTDFSGEEYNGSIQRLLSENIGEYVMIEFLIGTEMIMRKQGILFYTGVSYVTLYNDTDGHFMTCDLFSIKFVNFYQVKTSVPTMPAVPTQARVTPRGNGQNQGRFGMR